MQKDWNSLNTLNVHTGLLWNSIQSLLSLLLLEFKRNTSDWLSLDLLINSGGEASNLVFDFLALGISHLLDDLLVEIEILGQFTIEFLDYLS